MTYERRGDRRKSSRPSICSKLWKTIRKLSNDEDHSRSVHVAVLQNNELKVGYPS